MNQPATPTQQYDTDGKPPRFALKRAIFIMFGFTVISTALLAIVLPTVGLAEHRMMAVLSFAICGTVGILTMIPVALMDKQLPNGAAMGFMIGILFRMVLCAAAYFGFQATFEPQASAFAIWLSFAYLSALTVEVLILTLHQRMLLRWHKAHGSHDSNDTHGVEVAQC